MAEITGTPTKRCPFCGERILADAVKCRFCREFLEDDKGLPVSHHARRDTAAHPFKPRLPAQDPAPPQDDLRSHVLYSCRPSLWGLAGSLFTAALFFVIAGFLLFFPIGEQASKIVPEAAQYKTQIDRITGLVGMGLAGLLIAWLLYQIAVLKSIHYEISSDRIEFSRGVFSRKIDNLDMFRVVDLKLHRSLTDCLVGVGSVTLITKDETDPYFEFEKVADPKGLYDLIKVASLKADRRQGVVHLD